MTTLRVAGGRVLHPDLTAREGDVLADRETGEIVDVGPPDDVEGGDETLDADGCLVMPGLVNAHCHAAMTLLRGYADDEPLEVWLREDVWPVEAEMDDADVRAGADLALVEMIRAGTTAFADMYFGMPEVAAAVAEGGLCARLGHGVVDAGKDEAASRADHEESLAFAREYDGFADGRVRTMYAPHSLTTVDAALLREYVPAAREAGVPIHFHANETAEEVDPIVEARGERPLAYADDLGMLEPGDFVAHGVHSDASEIELLAERGAALVHCPASNMKLASGAAPIPAYRAAGATVALGTDGAASNNDLDLFDEMRDAAMLGKHAAGDASAVPAPAVVEMATAGGADALGVDAGRIEPGRRADLAVVDLGAAHLTPSHDVVSNLAYAARGSDVRHTVCDGRVLMRDREVTTLDEVAVRERAAARAADLVSRVE